MVVLIFGLVQVGIFEMKKENEREEKEKPNRPKTIKYIDNESFNNVLK